MSKNKQKLEIHMNLIEAITEIEKELGIEPPQGAFKLPPKLRYHEVLSELRKTICPHAEKLREPIRSDKAQLVGFVIDAIVIGLVNLPVAAATIARVITNIGIEEFCKVPEIIFDDEAS